MNYKKILWSLLAITLLWFRGKEDDPPPLAATVAPTMANFTSESKPVGTEITINGTNFSTTVASNTVKIGSARATQLKATVPTGATTAKVTVGGNTATSTKDFTVTNVDEGIVDDPASFILKFNVVAGQELTIGTNTFFDTYDYTIDWGDDSAPENRTTNTSPSHFYESEGTYLVAINGTFPSLNMQSQDVDTDSRNALVDVIQWGANKWQSMGGTFLYCVNLENFSATDQPDLSEVTNLNYTFFGASQFNGNLDNWDTRNVTTMVATFEYAHSFNQLLNWNTSNVTDMNRMFSNAITFNQPLVQTEGGWNTSKVTNMYHMFANDGGTYAFNQDLSSWDTSNVTDMSYMFYNEGGTHAFNQDLSSWDTSNVTDMSYMFYNEEGAHAFDQSLEAWDIGSVAGMDGMLDNSGLSPENYSATLVGWGSKGKPNIPDNITLGATGLKYCKTTIVNNNRMNLLFQGWQINDDGSTANCQL